MPDLIERLVSKLLHADPAPPAAGTPVRGPDSAASSAPAPVQPAEPQVGLPGDTRLSAGAGRTLGELASQAGEMGDLGLPGAAIGGARPVPELNRKPGELRAFEDTTRLWSLLTPQDADQRSGTVDKAFSRAIAPSTGRHDDGPSIDAKASRTDPAAQRAIAEALKADARRRLALQTLLAEGALAPRKGVPDDKSRLSAPVAADPPAIREDRQALSGEPARELATFPAIAPQDRGTGPAGAVPIVRASERPGEYAWPVAGPIPSEGRVTAASGDGLAREPGPESADRSARSGLPRSFPPMPAEHANADAEPDGSLSLLVGAALALVGGVLLGSLMGML